MSNVYYFSKLGLISSSIVMPRSITNDKEESKLSCLEIDLKNKEKTVKILIRSVKFAEISEVKNTLEKVYKEGWVLDSYNLRGNINL